jgi:opacity protein-like surface antigen
MKQVFLFLLISTIALAGFSQENLVSILGGYSFSSIEDSDVTASGWRINGSYGFNPEGGKWVTGIGIGYVSMTATASSGGADTAEYKLSSLPIYFEPKFLFGSDKAKGYVKGALGFHNSNYERTGTLLVVDGGDWGFYGGVGAGIKFFVSDLIFINAEYEFAWISNSIYKNELLNSIMGGIGLRF